MSSQILKRKPHRPDTGLEFLGDLSLVRGRAHEFCGPSRRTLALMLARAMEGPVYWIAPAWGTDRLLGDGVEGYVAPGRLTFLHPRRPEDLLWSAEEILRAGCVPLVICELPGLPGLTAVRRLHLAAEAGGGKGLGVLLLPGDGGAPGVESRWHLTPRHGPGRTAWSLERRRARTAPQKAWTLASQGRRFVLTPPEHMGIPAE